MNIRFRSASGGGRPFFAFFGVAGVAGAAGDGETGRQGGEGCEGDRTAVVGNLSLWWRLPLCLGVVAVEGGTGGNIGDNCGGCGSFAAVVGGR
ncbi:MAG: hypothetical protein GX303_02330 [Clostridiales bacterium]|nr:hypothetical protein [Clostridiales bacterium]